MVHSLFHSLRMNQIGFCELLKSGLRVPCARAERRTCFIVFLVCYNGSVPLGAAPGALRAPESAWGLPDWRTAVGRRPPTQLRRAVRA